MTSEGKGERGIRSILYALYQSPCPISINCGTQVFDESDGSKTSMTLIDGKVTIEHQKSKKSKSSKSSLQNNEEKTEITSNEEEEDKKESEKLTPEDESNNENQENKVDNDNNYENQNNNQNDNEIDNNNEENKPDNSFEYVTSAHGESPQYDFLIFVNDGKIEGDCKKDLRSQLIKIYKHVHRSLLNLYDLPITKLSLHFGINDKGEVEEEERNENDNQPKEEDNNDQSNDKENSSDQKDQNSNQDDQSNINEDQKTQENDNNKPEENGRLEAQVENSVNNLLGSPTKTENEEPNTQDNNDNNQEEEENGRLESQVEDNVNNLLGSPKKAENEEPPHSYEIFLLEDSYCTTSTQVVGPEDDDEDIDGKFGEFFSEEMKIKINYDRCYFDLPDCGVSNYKAPRSMCILLKAHKKFPKASCARLHDLIQTRFERFDEEETTNDEFDRNSYSTDLNSGSNYTVDSTSFNNREYNNFTKTIIDYDLYNDSKRSQNRPTSSQSKKSQKRGQKSSEKVSKNSTKDPSENSESGDQKTSELTDQKVFVCVRCWHLISSIDYVSFLQHQKTPSLHTLPPLPFQPVVQSELYEKRLYPMGLTGSLNKPFSFMLSVENSPYKKKVPQPRKPPPTTVVKRPSTVSSSRGKQQQQDVFSRLLSKTWTTQRNDGKMDRNFAISKGCRRPKTQPVKLRHFQENPAAVNNVKRSYARPPFDIGVMDPKRKKRLHPAFGGPEDFSFRIGGPNEVSGRKAGDDRPDFVI